jgi:hypothetical protein
MQALAGSKMWRCMLTGRGCSEPADPLLRIALPPSSIVVPVHLLPSTSLRHLVVRQHACISESNAIMPQLQGSERARLAVALADSRRCRYIARAQQGIEIQPIRNYLSRILVDLNTFFDDSDAVEKELCSVCKKYDWIIPSRADDERCTKEYYERHAEIAVAEQFALLGATTATDELEGKTVTSVWLAAELPSGSMFNLLTRLRCPVCVLVLHLMTPLPITSLLSWAANQSLAVLYGLQYTMHYVRPQKIQIKVKQPTNNIWQEAGTIETKSGSSIQCQTSSLSRASNVRYKTLRHWFSKCNNNHLNCRVARAESQRRKDIKIRLIDVIDERIVSGTLRNEYFALSYVWGGVECLKATKENISELEKIGALRKRSSEIPRSILDAMIFVTKLNARYLWVDALCIVQDNATEKHDQISLMHEIYAAAYATIVQHTGSDANAGLPGVREGSRSRITMQSRISDNILLAQASYVTPKFLNSSIHSTRGWTLQEVLLSSRCIHFSSKHITFVCRKEWAHDWIFQHSNQETVGRVRLGSMRPISHSMWQMNPFSLIDGWDGQKKDTTRTSWRRYFDVYGRIVAIYTTRALSFESDTLNAFQGLCGAITRLNAARFHFAIPSTCFDLALLWMNLGPGTRRASQLAPSWSWAAWEGQSTYNVCDFSASSSRPYYINSYVQQFYVMEGQDSVEIANGDFARATCIDTDLSTPYYLARKVVKDPIPDARLTQDLPHGCLQFWAEECPMDQLSINADQAVPFIEHAATQRRCGVIDPSIKKHNDGKVASLCGTHYSLILMSESRELLPYWIFDAGGSLTKANLGNPGVFMEPFVYPGFFEDEGWTGPAWVFNVLLIKRTGRFFERIAFGQMQMLDWLEMTRRRSYIRLV